MKTYYAYQLEIPIDFGFFHLTSVKDTVTHLASRVDTESDGDDDNGVTDLRDIVRQWYEAKKIAKCVGWDGDFRDSEPPCVFWLPGENHFIPAFVWKQENNGNTFVISTVELNWLKSMSIESSARYMS